MIQHYFRIAWRNLWKNKAFSLINIAGLAIGLTCCLLMSLYVKYELGYDSFQQKGDRIVRMIMEYSFSGSVNKGNYTSTKVAPVFKRTFPEVEASVRMTQASRVVHYQDKQFNEKRFMFADSSFFDLFSFPLLKGSKSDALSGPNKVVLTASSAERYFGKEDPVGKTIKVGSDETDYQVTGVIADCPSNSQIKYDFLASFSTLGANQEETYWNANYTTFLLLKDAASISALQAKIPGFMKNEMKGEVSGSDYVTFQLEPFKSIHLHSEYSGFEPNNSITYVYIVGAVAILMLLIACFTYINLSTARSMERAKEVGIRKVAGAEKKQVFWQFINESVIITFLSLCLSLALTALVLPAFNNLADRELGLKDLFSPFILLFAFIVMLSISFLAGSYPALILARFQPIKVLKGSFKNTASGLWLRRSLIVFQFVISVFLIIATFIIQNQLHFIQTKDLGYDRDHVLVMPMDGKMMKNIDALKTEFKTVPGVQNIARAVNDPTNILGGYNMRSASMPEETQIMTTANPVDEEFIKTTGIHILAGADFNHQDVLDVMKDSQNQKQYHYILNESAARELGWKKPEDAIGQKMFLGNQRPGYVKAVIRDFHFSSLHNPIKPLVLFNEEWTSTMLVKVSGSHLSQTIDGLQAKWKGMIPHRPFEYHFLDADYDKLYSAELRLGKVLNIFTAIAILLACLGLFGLSAYAIQQRTKEIGIRKVLGASVSNVVTLLSRDFIRLVIVAIVIAFPVAGWVMFKWLQDFTYRIEMSWWMFAIAAFAALFITLFTISFQAIRTALGNPVKSLRTE
ncbi:MAG TPA: ABC transporter permease [Flavisolibacter sp.]|jgi:putative ABC transport system permease protein|nr:ABC transporter permease [Flavisolibacter sp.]